MVAKTPEMMGNLMIVGAAGAFLLSTIFATVVFDKTSPNTTVSSQEIELGMQVKATDQHIEVFMDATLPLHILVDIVNISKVDSEGNGEPGDITDLFPVSGPATGRGSMLFKIEVIDSSAFPNLANLSQALVPMAYIKESTLNETVRSFLKFGSVLLKYFKLIGWLVFLISLGMVAAGAGLVFTARKNRSPPLVDPLQ